MLSAIPDILLAIAALICLALPWMYPGTVRGFRFLLSSPPGPISDNLFGEFRMQLLAAVAFILLSLAVAAWGQRRKSGSLVKLLAKTRFILGAATALLCGNLAFHIGLLELAAEEAPWFSSPMRIRSQPMDITVLFQTEPAYGLWAFLILSLMLFARATLAAEARTRSEMRAGSSWSRGARPALPGASKKKRRAGCPSS